MVGHGGSSAGSYLADPTSPIPSHCASIVMTSTLRVMCSLQVCVLLTSPQLPKHMPPTVHATPAVYVARTAAQAWPVSRHHPRSPPTHSAQTQRTENGSRLKWKEALIKLCWDEAQCLNIKSLRLHASIAYNRHPELLNDTECPYGDLALSNDTKTQTFSFEPA